MYKLAAFLLFIVLISCNDRMNNNNQSDTLAGNTAAKEMHIMIPKTACYAYINNKDTIRLKIEQFPNVVTGTLEYNLYEKDKNKGEIDGSLHRDTLIANYTFLSEGKKSVRQVVFLLADSVATEGYADMEEKNDTMFFKNITQLDFSKGIKLHSIDCLQP